MTKLFVDNIWTRIEPDRAVMTEEHIKELTLMMSYVIKEYARWTGEYVELEYTLLEEDEQGLKYPTGLYSVLHEALSTRKIPYEVVDLRTRPKQNPPHVFKSKTLRDYQEDAVQKAIKAERGILQLSTGAGKTTVGAAIITRLAVKTLFIVNSIDLLDQAYDEFVKMISGVKIGKIGGGECDISDDINICTVQTLHTAFDLKYIKAEDDVFETEKVNPKLLEQKERIKKTIREADLIISDECHHLQSASYVNVMQSNSSFFRYGLSATPYKMESKDMVINAYSGKTIVRITASELIDKGFLVPPHIYFIDPNENQKYIYTKGAFNKIYKQWILNNKNRNGCIVSCAERLIELNKTMLITISQIEHGELLQELLYQNIPDAKVAFIQGSVKRKDRRILLDKVRSRELNVLIGTSVADEGLDLPALDAAIIGGGGKSFIKTIQRVGRTLRPFEGKKEAIIIDFNDRIRYLSGQSKRRMEIYRQEPRFIVSQHF